jgi:hypothetical protein
MINLTRITDIMPMSGSFVLAPVGWPRRIRILDGGWDIPEQEG